MPWPCQELVRRLLFAVAEAGSAVDLPARRLVPHQMEESSGQALPMGKLKVLELACRASSSAGSMGLQSL